MEPRSHFTAIIEFYGTHKRMPTYREIMRLAGFRSTNAASKLVRSSSHSSSSIRTPKECSFPSQSFSELRVLGTDEAGLPAPAEEALLDTLSLDEYLIRNKEASYLLGAQGDSMIDAGILPGDSVLVERSADAKDGDIVIAEVDGEWKMKLFWKQGRRVALEPANKQYPVWSKN